MEVTAKLTKAQRRVLTMIKRFIRTHGYPPTRLNVCEKLGFASLNAAQGHIDALKRKGAITVDPHISRGIRVNL
jgi:repressor LexA